MFLKESEVRKIIRKRLISEMSKRLNEASEDQQPQAKSNEKTASNAPVLPGIVATVMRSNDIKNGISAFINSDNNVASLLMAFLKGMGVSASDLVLFPDNGQNSFNTLSVDIQSATTSNLGLGFGTDQDELRDLVFSPMGAKIGEGVFSFLDIARLSQYYYNNITAIKQQSTDWSMFGTDDDEEERNLGRLLFDSSFLGDGELSAGDITTYVINPFVTASGYNMLNEFPVYIIKAGANIKGIEFEEDTAITFADLEAGKFLGGRAKEVEAASLINIGELAGNDVEKIQFIMNKYSTDKGLGVTINVDGIWGSQTDSLWEAFSNHVFGNHPTFSVHESAGTFTSGMHSWEDVSGKLVTSHPAYTPDTTGCLAFCADAINGNTEYGDGKPFTSVQSDESVQDSNTAITGAGAGSASSGRGSRQSGGIDRQGQSIGRAPMPEIRVRLAGPDISTLEDIGLPKNTTKQLAEHIVDRVRGGATTGGTVNLTIVVNRRGIVSNVRRSPGQRRSQIARQFERLPTLVSSFLKKAGNIDNKSIVPSGGRAAFRARSRKFELVIEFQAGRY